MGVKDKEVTYDADGKPVFRDKAAFNKWATTGAGRTWLASNTRDYSRTGETIDPDDAVKRGLVSFDVNVAAPTTGGGNNNKKTTPTKSTQATAAPGRPIESGLKIQPLDLKGSIEPQYAKLRQEVLADNPILGLDETTKNLLAKQGQVTSDMLSGVLPEDVERRVTTIAAARASKSGINLWSQAGRNAEARDLGLTTLDLQQKGIEASQAMIESERKFKTERMQLLQDARRLDLNAAELKLQQLKLDRAERLDRLKIATSTVMQYHEQLYRYNSLKKAQQANVDALSSDFDALMATIKNLSAEAQ